jgi:hypothetical protein
MAAELKQRRWIGIEIGSTNDIVRRFADIEKDRKLLTEQRRDLNVLFPKKIHAMRKAKGLWTCESVRAATAEHPEQFQLKAIFNSSA